MGLRRGRRIGWPPVLILIPCLLACTWDQDERYRPLTLGALFLVQDASTGKTALIRATGSDIRYGWETALGLGPGEVSDLAPGPGLTVWLALKESERLIETDPVSGRILRQIRVSGFRPHRVCAGERQMLAADTLSQEILFIRIRNGQPTRLRVTGKPGPAIYQSGKFFMGLNDTSVLIISEQALAVAGSASLPQPLEYLDWNGDYAVAAFFRQNSLLFQQRLNYNFNGPEGGPRRMQADHWRYSPYAVAAYGTEWLEPLFIQSDTLQPWGISPAIEFFPDFFTATAWVRSDSLRCFDAEGRQQYPGLALPGKVLAFAPVRQEGT